MTRMPAFDATGTVPGQRGGGTVSGTSVAAGASVSVTVTFPTAFAAAPADVYAQLSGFVTGGGMMLIRQVDTITAADCRVVFLNVGTGAATFTSLPFRWMAIP